MKPGLIVKDLIVAAEQLGFRVRYDTGNFRGGACTLREEGLIVLNRRHPAEVHLGVLANALRTLPVDSVYLRPAVRSALQEVWAEAPLEELSTDGD